MSIYGTNDLFGAEFLHPLPPAPGGVSGQSTKRVLSTPRGDRGVAALEKKPGKLSVVDRIVRAILSQVVGAKKECRKMATKLANKVQRSKKSAAKANSSQPKQIVARKAYTSKTQELNEAKGQVAKDSTRMTMMVNGKALSIFEGGNKDMSGDEAMGLQRANELEQHLSGQGITDVEQLRIFNAFQQGPAADISKAATSKEDAVLRDPQASKQSKDYAAFKMNLIAGARVPITENSSIQPVKTTRAYLDTKEKTVTVDLFIDREYRVDGAVQPYPKALEKFSPAQSYHRLIYHYDTNEYEVLEMPTQAWVDDTATIHAAAPLFVPILCHNEDVQGHRLIVPSNSYNPGTQTLEKAKKEIENVKNRMTMVIDNALFSSGKVGIQTEHKVEDIETYLDAKGITDPKERLNILRAFQNNAPAILLQDLLAVAVRDPQNPSAEELADYNLATGGMVQLKDANGEENWFGAKMENRAYLDTENKTITSDVLIDRSEDNYRNSQENFPSEQYSSKLCYRVVYNYGTGQYQVFQMPVAEWDKDAQKIEGMASFGPSL